MNIFAVCYSNYHPREIDSLWIDEADADARVDELEGDWRVYEMEVHESRLTQRALDECHRCGANLVTESSVHDGSVYCTACGTRQ